MSGLPPTHVTWWTQQLKTHTDLHISEQSDAIQNQAKQESIGDVVEHPEETISLA